MDEKELEAQAQTEEPIALTDGNADGNAEGGAAMDADSTVDVQSEPTEDYEESLLQNEQEYEASEQIGEGADGEEWSDDGDGCEVDEEKPRRAFKADGIFEFVELFVFTIAVVVFLLSFAFRHSVVDGDSMQNTLQHGEHLIISDLFYRPDYGDIIVFEDRSTGYSDPMIKRVIALEGDTVKINSDGSVYVNGVLLDEDYVYINGYYNQHPIEYTVPEGEVYVMGDHRNMSSDSRVFGAIDEDTILGRVILRFYPFDTFGKVS